MPPTDDLNPQARCHRDRREALRLAARLGCEVRTVEIKSGMHVYYAWPREGVTDPIEYLAIAHSWAGLLTQLQRAAAPR